MAIGSKEMSYLTTILDCTAQSHPDKTLADALKVCSCIVRGYTLEAARHQVNVVLPRMGHWRKS